MGRFNNSYNDNGDRRGFVNRGDNKRNEFGNGPRDQGDMPQRDEDR